VMSGLAWRVLLLSKQHNSTDRRLSSTTKLNVRCDLAKTPATVHVERSTKRMRYTGCWSLAASGATFEHRHPRGERGVEPSFLTCSVEQRHQINGTMSGEHLHSTWCRGIPRCCSHTSNIVDWLRLWRGHPTSWFKKTRAYYCSSCALNPHHPPNKELPYLLMRHKRGSGRLQNTITYHYYNYITW
jgi:hypothetical protein